MGWRIVEVHTDEYMQLYLNNLQINRMGERILINLGEIETLLIQNTRAAISINLLNALAEHNINVVIMNPKHEPCAQLVPVSGHHASLQVLQKQLGWTHQYKALAWQGVIKNKLYNQMRLLQRANLLGDQLFWDVAISEVKPLDISNREGHAAKVYWHSLFGKSFLRVQQASQGEDVINNMLDYGYAILRSTMIRAIFAKGLDPRLSLFHKTFTNFFALASDLMEPFRPLIDEIVIQRQHETIFSRDSRDLLVGVLEAQVRIDDVKFYLPLACDKLVDQLLAGNGCPWVALWD